MRFEHAWNLCPRSGQAIDATWNVGTVEVYLGIQMSPKELASVVSRTQRFGVFETGCGFDYDLVVELWGWNPIRHAKRIDADPESVGYHA